MRIGKLARELGVATKALRFYEECGLPPRRARVANGYRDFGPDDLVRLRVLIGLHRLDVGQAEAADLENLCADGRCERVADGVRTAIAARQAETTRRLSELAGLDAGSARLDTALAGEPRATAPHPSRQKGGNGDV